jgi:hypothetical protein
MTQEQIDKECDARRQKALSICPELAEEIERLKAEWTKRMEDYREQKDKPNLNPILQTKLNTSFLIYRDVLKELELLKESEPKKVKMFPEQTRSISDVLTIPTISTKSK